MKLTIEDGCSVFTSSAAGTLDFGAWTTLSDHIDASTTFNVSCNTAGTAAKTVEVGLDGGLNNSTAARKLFLAGDSTKTINYSLFSDSARTKNWGTQSGTDTFAQPMPTTAGGNVAFTVYGRVPAQATIPGVGTYTDTVKVSVNIK